MNAAEFDTASLDPTIGDEIRKMRPVVILNGVQEKHLKLGIVAPVTQCKPLWERSPFISSPFSLRPSPSAASAWPSGIA